MKHNPLIAKLNEVDPVAIGEKAGFSDMEALSLQMALSARMKAELSKTGDTNSDTTFDEWIKIAEGVGFKVVYSEETTASHCGRPPIRLGFRIMHRTGQLIVLESFGDHVNRAKLHFNAIRVMREDFGWDGMSGTDRPSAFSVDVREGLLHRLWDVEFNSRPCPCPESDRHFVWDILWSETKCDHSIYEKLRGQRFAKLPREIQDEFPTRR